MNLFGNNNFMRREREEPEVNMTAVMNIFLILIPFLLLTAVFAKIAVLEISLPTGSGGGSGSESIPPPEKSVLVVVKIMDGGKLQIMSSSPDIVRFDPIYSLADNKYNYEQLISQLQEVKEKLPWLDELVLQPEDNVQYDVIVKVMDRCRENGFDNVTLAT
jgi:biopolymer transport protein ExbD